MITPPRVGARSGMSLLELSVCIVVLIFLISIAFVGARAWKRSSERTNCILTIKNVQIATRSYQNLYDYRPGGKPYAFNGSQDIASHLFTKGYIKGQTFAQLNGIKNCPSGGSYNRSSPDIFPEEGDVYMTCSLSDQDGHELPAKACW